MEVIVFWALMIGCVILFASESLGGDCDPETGLPKTPEGDEEDQQRVFKVKWSDLE